MYVFIVTQIIGNAPEHAYIDTMFQLEQAHTTCNRAYPQKRIRFKIATVVVNLAVLGVCTRYNHDRHGCSIICTLPARTSEYA